MGTRACNTGADLLARVRAGDYSSPAGDPAAIVTRGSAHMIRLSINGRTHDVDVDPTTPLLWVIREQVGLTGTKYGCGVAQCGACTVHVDGQAMRSCSVPVSAVAGRQVTTIEGLSSRA